MDRRKLTVAPEYDVVLVGGGIMSATLGLLLHELDPTLHIAIFERLGRFAQESSAPWNNAGTGHSAYCEFNYTPQMPDGTVNISKAEKIAEQFEVTKQFYSYLVKQGIVQNPETFINACPHMSFVFGESDREFLHKRYEALTASPLFRGMEITEDHDRLREWVPLMMHNRQEGEVLAATKMELGTDVNFGSLTRMMSRYLDEDSTANLFIYHEVKDLKKLQDGRWEVKVKDRVHQKVSTTTAKFVFVGAGGYALPLLEDAELPEAEGYGGFPVSGQWLVCKNPEVVKHHDKKVYTNASLDAPPMSVPHLDLRIINGEKSLLFGPFAGFSTKFLKKGSYLDLPESVNFKNIRSLFGAWWHNIPLTKYLISQVAMTKDQRMAHLREFYPAAREEDWELMIAGQRVQIIKRDEKDGGRLEFGTEIIVSRDKTLASLLGASPGASTATPAMLGVLEQCFPQLVESHREKLQEIIPTYGQKLGHNRELVKETRRYTSSILHLMV